MQASRCLGMKQEGHKTRDQRFYPLCKFGFIYGDRGSARRDAAFDGIPTAAVTQSNFPNGPRGVITCRDKLNLWLGVELEDEFLHDLRHVLSEEWEARHSEIANESIRRLSHWGLWVFQAQDEQLEKRGLADFDEWFERHTKALSQAG